MRNRMRQIVLGLFLILLTIPQPALATESQAKEIEQMLICPACIDTGMTVDYCPDSVAEGIRNQVEQKLAMGQTKNEIVNAYVAEHGISLLAKPKTSGSGLLAWVMPVVGVGVGLGLVYFLLGRSLSRQPQRMAAPKEGVTEEDWQEKVDKEIKKYL